MKKNTKIVIGILIALIIFVGFIIVIRAGMHKMTVEKEQNKVIANVSNENITKKEFDMIKESILLNDMKMGDQEILSRMTVQKAICLDALRNKVTIDDKAIKMIITEQQEKVKNSQKYQILKSDLKRLEIPEKEYWENEAKRLKENAIRDQYKYLLKRTFNKANSKEEKKAIELKFNEFYSQITAKAISAADIKILVEYK